MPVGANTGETVSNSLISPVAATLQAPEVPAAEQAPVKQSAPSSDEMLKRIKGGEMGREAVQEEIEKLQRKVEAIQQEKEEKEKVSNKEQVKGVEKKIEEVLRKEARDNQSRERKRKGRGEGSGERARSASEKRRREEVRRSREEEELRKTREDYPPHKGCHGKGKSDKDRAASRNNGSHN